MYYFALGGNKMENPEMSGLRVRWAQKNMAGTYLWSKRSWEEQVVGLDGKQAAYPGNERQKKMAEQASSIQECRKQGGNHQEYQPGF